MRAHLLEKHGQTLQDNHPDLYWVFHPNTRSAASAAHSEANGKVVGSEKSPIYPRWSHPQRFLLPGTFDVLDVVDPHRAELSLGLGLYGSPHYLETTGGSRLAQLVVEGLRDAPC